MEPEAEQLWRKCPFLETSAASRVCLHFGSPGRWVLRQPTCVRMEAGVTETGLAGQTEERPLSATH